MGNDASYGIHGHSQQERIKVCFKKIGCLGKHTYRLIAHHTGLDPFCH